MSLNKLRILNNADTTQPKLVRNGTCKKFKPENVKCVSWTAVDFIHVYRASHTSIPIDLPMPLTIYR